MAKAHVKILEVDKGFAALRKTLKSLKERGSYVKVGVFGKDSKAREDGETVSNVDLAIIHEFGAPKASIPARPFLGGTFDAKKADYAATIRRGLEKVYVNEMTVETLLGAVGAQMAADVKARVREGTNFEPNTPEVFARKLAKSANRKRRKEGPVESPKPLIDTGRLIGSVTWDVVLQERSAGASGGGPKKGEG